MCLESPVRSSNLLVCTAHSFWNNLNHRDLWDTRGVRAKMRRLMFVDPKIWCSLTGTAETGNSAHHRTFPLCAIPSMVSRDSTRPSSKLSSCFANTMVTASRALQLIQTAREPQSNFHNDLRDLQICSELQGSARLGEYKSEGWPQSRYLMMKCISSVRLSYPSHGAVSLGSSPYCHILVDGLKKCLAKALEVQEVQAVWCCLPKAALLCVKYKADSEHHLRVLNNISTVCIWIFCFRFIEALPSEKAKSLSSRSGSLRLLSLQRMLISLKMQSQPWSRIMFVDGLLVPARLYCAPWISYGLPLTTIGVWATNRDCPPSSTTLGARLKMCKGKLSR